MRHTKVALAILAAFAIAPAAVAQSGGRNISIGISGGPSFPTGDRGESLNTGFHIAGHLGVQPRLSTLGLRFDVMYDNWDIENTTGDLRSIGGTGNLMINLPTGSASVRPYLSVGAGVYNVKQSRVGNNETNAGLNGGIGIDFPLSGIATFGELRFHSIFTEDRNTNFVPLVFGIRF
jgi:hypothetical protein